MIEELLLLLTSLFANTSDVVDGDDMWLSMCFAFCCVCCSASAVAVSVIVRFFKVWIVVRVDVLEELVIEFGDRFDDFDFAVVVVVSVAEVVGGDALIA